MRAVLEPRVAETMPYDVGVRGFADRQRGGAPKVSRCLVADVDRLRGCVADGIVRPGRELVFPGIHRPGAAGTVGRHLESELGIGDDIDPGRGSPLTLIEHHDVLARGFGEAAQSI